jgi:hypothetical protein
MSTTEHNSSGVDLMSITSTAGPRPRFGKIPAAVAYSGRSRARLYVLAGQHEGLFKKDGGSTIVDFDILDQILDALPVAKIKAPEIDAA